MTIEQTIADEIARVHVEINDASDALRQRLHDAVCSWQDVHRQNQELQALVNRQRGELDDLRAANRAYARMLADVRTALDAVDDADLVEAARSLTAEVKRLIMQDILKRERAERAEVALADLQEDRRVAATVINNTRAVLNRVDSALDEIFGLKTEPTILGSQAARVVARLEQAEAECERLRTGIALARAYKAAVDDLNGVADAEAALFAWLEEVDHVQS